VNNIITVQNTKAKQKRHLQDQMSITKKHRNKHNKKEARCFTSGPGG